MKNTVLTVGSMAFDGIEAPAGKVRDVVGGSATYFACAARLFAPVRVVSVVGPDFPGDHLRGLRGKGIDLAGVHVAQGKTFRWTGSYCDNLNEAKTLSVSLNVMQGFTPDIPPAYRDSPFVFLANIDPDIQWEVVRQVRKPRLVICDTMNHWIQDKPASLKRVIKSADILVVNEGEARLLTGRKNMLEAAGKLQAMGPTAVIIKRGEYGVLLVRGKSIFLMPAYPVRRVIDPTGAGDSFGGAFTGYLAASGVIDGPSLCRAAAYGTVVASFTVEEFGTRRLERLTRREVEQRFKELRRILCF